MTKSSQSYQDFYSNYDIDINNSLCLEFNNAWGLLKTSPLYNLT